MVVDEYKLAPGKGTTLVIKLCARDGLPTLTGQTNTTTAQDTHEPELSNRCTVLHSLFAGYRQAFNHRKTGWMHQRSFKKKKKGNV